MQKQEKNRSPLRWILPLLTLTIVFAVGVLLLRPGETAYKGDYGTQVGVGGGPPHDIDATLTPTPTLAHPVSPTY